MDLSATKYHGCWEHDKEERVKNLKKLKAFGFDESDIAEGSPGYTLSIRVAYWRKANAIHRWFVEKVQDGKDECQASDVSRKQLEELLGECEKVLANKGDAKKLLPTRSGFFFGDTEYNDWYWGDIAGTIKQLRSVLNNPKFEDWSFEYRASW